MSSDDKYGRHLEKRAEELGLPTDPAAYQDGGLVPAGTAYGINEADLIAAMLRNAGIPAWVEGAGTASWYWHMQFAMHPGGIRILVPMGRAAEAQALVAAHGKTPPESLPPEQDGTAAVEEQPPPEEAQELEDPATPLFRRARSLAFLLFIPFTYPVIFVLSCVLLLKIRRQRRLTGATPCLRKARWIALVTFMYLFLTGLMIGLAYSSAFMRTHEPVELEGDETENRIIIKYPVGPSVPKR